MRKTKSGFAGSTASGLGDKCVIEEPKVKLVFGSTVVPRVVTDAGVNCFLPAGLKLCVQFGYVSSKGKKGL